MACWKDKNRKYWRYHFEFQKQRYTGQGYKTKKEALAAMEKHKSEVRGSKQILRGMGFRQLAGVYLDFAERRFVTKTYKYKAYVYKSFLDFHGDKLVDSITPYDIESYLNTRGSANNYNVHRKELGALFSYGVNVLRVLSDNPVKRVGKLPHNSKVRKIPSSDDVKKIIASVFGEDRLFLLLILYLAARVDEVLRLRWIDVDFDKGVVTRWTRKRLGGSYEAIYSPVDDRVLNCLNCSYEARVQDEWIFYNSRTKTRIKERRKFLKYLCDRCGVPPIHYHELRHYIASVLANTPGV